MQPPRAGGATVVGAISRRNGQSDGSISVKRWVDPVHASWRDV